MIKHKDQFNAMQSNSNSKNISNKKKKRGSPSHTISGGPSSPYFPNSSYTTLLNKDLVKNSNRVNKKSRSMPEASMLYHTVTN